MKLLSFNPTIDVGEKETALFQSSGVEWEQRDVLLTESEDLEGCVHLPGPVPARSHPLPGRQRHVPLPPVPEG